MKLFGSITELVSLVWRKNSQTVTLRPNQSTTYTAARDIQTPAQDADSVLVSRTSTDTLTNKTLTAPVMTAPVLGVATATSVNKVTITAPATSATLTVADGKTLTASNTLTFTGTDSSSVAFGAGGTAAYTANKLSAFAATSSSELAGVISDETGSGKLVFATAPQFSTNVDLLASAEHRYYNSGNTFYTGFKGGAAAASKIWTLPLVDGSSSQVLGTDGSATLGWYSALTNPMNAVGDVVVGGAAGAAAKANTVLLGDVVASQASATVTITIATPGVVSYTSHGLSAGAKVYLTTTGALPTGLSASTAYYVVTVDANSFSLATSYANAIAATKIATSGSQSGTHTLFSGGLSLPAAPSGAFYEDYAMTTTFTFNGTGSPGTTGSVSLKLTRIGSLVTMRVGSNAGILATSGTSSTALISNTAIPARFLPAVIIGSFCQVINSGTDLATPGFVTLSNSTGKISIFRDAAYTAFSSAVSCGNDTAFAISWVVS